MSHISTSHNTSRKVMRSLKVSLPILLGLLVWTTALSVYLGMLWLSDGNPLLGIGLFIVIALFLLTIFRPGLSLIAMLGFVLLFDQFGIPGFLPWTMEADYFRNIKEIRYLPSVSAGVINLIEVHLLLLLFVWIFHLALNKQSRLYHVPLWGAALVFYGLLIASFVFGMKTGGEFLVALWEVRALFYMGIMYFLVPQLIQTRRELELLMWVCIGAITFKALQGFYRFASMGFSFQGKETLTNHEDPVFIVTLIVLLIGLALFKADSRQRKVLLLLLVPLFVGYMTGQRRAAYASMMVVMAAMFFLLPYNERRQAFKVALPIVLVLLVYMAMFWNSRSVWGGPVQQIKSGIYSDDKETAGDSYYSNLYRDFEDYNLAQTIKRKPVTGVGFGNKYDMPIPLIKIKFPLRDYIPHNEIYWLLVKMGSVGFTAFLFFMFAFAARGTNVLLQLKDPYLKALTLMIVLAVINQLVVSFFDLQLTYYRNMIYLGTLMGLLSTIEVLGGLRVNSDESEESDEILNINS